MYFVAIILMYGSEYWVYVKKNKSSVTVMVFIVIYREFMRGMN